MAGVVYRSANGCRTSNDPEVWSNRVRKLSESGFISGHYTGKTDLKLDSLCFLTQTPNFRVIWHSAAIQHSAKYPCNLKHTGKNLYSCYICASVLPHSFCIYCNAFIFSLILKSNVPDL